MTIGIIGLGNIGGALAQYLLPHHDVCLYDIQHEMVQGKRLDLQHAATLWGRCHDAVQAVNCVQEMAFCDIIVITAGLSRRPGMTRDDLLLDNGKILASIAQDLRHAAYKGHLIVVSNPVDTMTWFLKTYLDHPKTKIIGMGSLLDTARFLFFLGQALNKPLQDLKGMVIGPHHEDMFVPRSSLHVAGQPFDDQDILDAVLTKTRTAGAQIVHHLQGGSAFFGPAKAIFTMIQAIVHDENVCIPCSVLASYEGQEISCGLPVILGQKGWCPAPLHLETAESAHLQASLKKLASSQKLLEPLLVL